MRRILSVTALFCLGAITAEAEPHLAAAHQPDARMPIAASPDVRGAFGIPGPDAPRATEVAPVQRIARIPALRSRTGASGRAMAREIERADAGSLTVAQAAGPRENRMLAAGLAVIGVLMAERRKGAARN